MPSILSLPLATTVTNTTDYVPVVQGGVTKRALVGTFSRDLTQPRLPLTSFAWVNKNATSTATDFMPGPLSMNVATVTSTQNIQALVTALPAASNFTVTIGVTDQLLSENYLYAGLIMCDASYNNIIMYGVGQSTTSVGESERPVQAIIYFANATTFSANKKVWGYTKSQTNYWRCKDDGTNRIFSFSRDNVQWSKFAVLPRADLSSTLSRVGFGIGAVDNNNTGVDAVAGLSYFSMTVP